MTRQTDRVGRQRNTPPSATCHIPPAARPPPRPTLAPKVRSRRRESQLHVALDPQHLHAMALSPQTHSKPKPKRWSVVVVVRVVHAGLAGCCCTPAPSPRAERANMLPRPGGRRLVQACVYVCVCGYDHVRRRRRSRMPSGSPPAVGEHDERRQAS